MLKFEKKKSVAKRLMLCVSVALVLLSTALLVSTQKRLLLTPSAIHTCPYRLWGATGTGTVSARVKRPGLEADLSFSSSAEIKNE